MALGTGSGKPTITQHVSTLSRALAAIPPPAHPVTSPAAHAILTTQAMSPAKPTVTTHLAAARALVPGALPAGFSFPLPHPAAAPLSGIATSIPKPVVETHLALASSAPIQAAAQQAQNQAALQALLSSRGGGGGTLPPDAGTGGAGEAPLTATTMTDPGYQPNSVGTGPDGQTPSNMVDWMAATGGDPGTAAALNTAQYTPPANSTPAASMPLGPDGQPTGDTEGATGVATVSQEEVFHYYVNYYDALSKAGGA
jgi:hypothetical protein